MIRISFIFSVLLIFSANAKPMKKMSDKLLKKMVVSLDEKGKMAWGDEVEPPEDMDGIHYEIDPSMKIWKNMKISEQGKHHLKPEEDLDEMYHPSTLDLQAQIRKFEQKAEKKNEHQHSPAKMEQMREVRIHLQPEEDMDDLHHKDLLLPALKPGLVRAAVDLPSQRKYLKPEEDLDDLYHRKLLLPVVQQEVREAPAVLPSQRKYTKPEEDLDGLYHQ